MQGWRKVVRGICTALALMGCALAPDAFAQPGATPVCASCHQQSHASIAATHHGAKNDASGSMCQACHGDASKHLEDPVKNKMVNLFANAPAEQKSNVCLTCHAASRHLTFWESGKH